MKMVSFAFALMLAAIPARADIVIAPQVMNGFGTVSVVNASALISTVTVGPNSTAFPASTLPNQTFSIRNSVSSAGVLYVCPLGGTCTTAVGIPLAVGEVKTWGIGGRTVVPSVIAVTTATAVVEW